jgi:hypothetical protein
MTKLGLTINEAKTSVKDARQERFTLLGYSFGPHWFKANGEWYLGASPSKKSMQRVKTKVGDLLVPGNTAPWQEVRDTLNKSLRGWSNDFCYGTRRSAFRSFDHYVRERARIPRQTAQSDRARQSPVPIRRTAWGTWCAVPTTPAMILLRRVPCGEASRRAGCGSSARPVR